MVKNNVQVCLNPYPFPFKAAATISNDVDGLTWSSYEELHEFINGSESGSLGDGLGLEIGNSFWVWSQSGEFSLRHAGPWESSQTPSPESGRITDLVEAGWLDTLHNFGDWSKGYYLSRDDINRGFEILDELPVLPNVFVNHGGGDLRTHNIGGPWAAYQAGDDPESSQYILDKLLERGIEYYWTDSLFEKNKFGDYLNEYDLSFKRWTTVAQLSEYQTKFGQAEVFGAPASSIPLAVQSVLVNRTLFPLVGRDGSAFYGFKRFRGEEAPHSGCLDRQLQRNLLDELVRNSGTVVLYQHLGVWRPDKSIKWDSLQMKNRSPILPFEAVEALRLLAEYHHSGLIFVTTVSRLLKYLRLRDYLGFESHENSDGGISINITHVDCPVGGKWVPTINDLSGISFNVLGSSADPKIFLDGQSLVQHQKIDSTGEGVSGLTVYLPWQKLEWVNSPVSPKRQSPAPYFPIDDGNKNGMPPISHKMLKDHQLEKWIQMMTSKRNETGFKREAPHIRKDLKFALQNWQSTEFPSTFGAAVKYAEQMHRHELEKYIMRLEKLGCSGKLVLDAGCGSGTWSFALSNYFDHVVGIDKTRTRVDLASWLYRKYGNSRIDISYGDVTNMDFDDATFDFVFCNGVLITTAIDIVVALREFYRVLSPGGSMYVCLNGIGWSKYLRDDRGKNSASQKLIGHRGLYNTQVQTKCADLNANFSKIRVKLEELEDDNTKFSDSQRTYRELKDYLARLTAADPRKLTEVEGPWSDGQKLFGSMLSELDSLGQELLAVDLGLEEVRNYLLENCNSDFVDTFLQDVLLIFSGLRAEFSFKSGGFGYTPEQIEEIVERIGFENFRWGREAELSSGEELELEAQEFFGGEFGGELKVWEFLVTKPELKSTVSHSN